jgi:hypothetical protein
MRNEKEFKKRISEIAANIAGVDEKVNPEKLTLPGTFVSQANSAVGNPSDLAVALLDIINELLVGEKSMQDIAKRPGWNLIMDRLKSLAGEKKGEEGEVPEVTPEDEKMAGGPKALQEAFNRINRK